MVWSPSHHFGAVPSQCSNLRPGQILEGSLVVILRVPLFSCIRKMLACILLLILIRLRFLSFIKSRRMVMLSRSSLVFGTFYGDLVLLLLMWLTIMFVEKETKLKLV